MASGRNQTRSDTAGLATACTALANVVRFLAAFSRLLLVVVDMVVVKGGGEGCGWNVAISNAGPARMRWICMRRGARWIFGNGIGGIENGDFPQNFF